MYSFAIVTPLSMPLLYPVLHLSSHMYFRKIIIVSVSVPRRTRAELKEAGVGRNSEHCVKQFCGIPNLLA